MTVNQSSTQVFVNEKNKSTQFIVIRHTFFLSRLNDKIFGEFRWTTKKNENQNRSHKTETEE